MTIVHHSAGRVRRQSLALLAGVGLAGLLSCESEPTANEPLVPSDRAVAQAVDLTPTVFATGLRYPRGFTFGPDGSLYVAEAGSGGKQTTRPSRCDQVVAPVGPYTNGRTARISKIDSRGRRTTFASGFPSAMNAMGDVLGVADVAFVGGKLFALVAGGGCSHGSTSVPAGVAKVSSSGDWTIVTDLSSYLAAHPAAEPEADDFEPDGTWYSMVAIGGKLFAVEPNHGELTAMIPPNWHPNRVADISRTQGHVVPTALAQLHGGLYVGNLGVFPVKPGSEKILTVSRGGDVAVDARGFTAVLGLDFDSRGRKYVLEMTHGAGFPTPGTGRVVRVNANGTHDVIVDHLDFPTAMRFGPDGRLYISNKGFGPPGPGEILRVDVPGAAPADLVSAR